MARDGLPARMMAMAAIRAAEAQGGQGMLLKRGDADSGQIFLKVMNRAGETIVYAQSRDADDAPIWRRATGPEPVVESVADEKLARERKFDPDIWIVEIQKEELSHPLGLTVS